MDQLHSTTLTPDRERGQHLKFEDRCSIKIFRKLGYSLRAIAAIINCSPSTVMYELRRGTGNRKSNVGRPPEYSAKRGQANYEINRSRCHRPHKLNTQNPFIDWMVRQFREQHWSLDACVGYARKNQLFPKEQIVCTKTLYNELLAGNLPLKPLELPELLSRRTQGTNVPGNRRILGRSIEERSEEAGKRAVCGHWEIDTVVGRRKGRESVVLTLTEKKTDIYLALKIPGKDSDSVMAAIAVLKEEYGEKYFSKIFKTITADNGSEFTRLSELEEDGVSVYFAHPYSSWERAQNERHNRLFRRYIPKGKSIDNYSAEQILCFADEMNALPRKHLGYSTPEELFDKFLDQVYSVGKVQWA